MKRYISAWRERRGTRPASALAPAEARADERLCDLPRALPTADARRVLVLAPHPDDECIGCGGLLLYLSRVRIPTRVVLVSDGSGAGGLFPGADRIRHAEFMSALTVLGISDHVWLQLPDGALAFDARLPPAIDAEIRRFQPNWIVAPAAADLHRDHRAVFEAACVAANTRECVEAVWQYETWSALSVTHVLDITASLGLKLDALGQHRTALACGNYLRATEGLARYRGLLLGGTHPDAAAEAFLRTSRESEFR